MGTQLIRASQSDSGVLEARDYGLLRYNMAPGSLSGTYQLGTNGTVYVAKLRTNKPITVTNLHIFVTVAIGTPTSGQNFAALYSSSKQLLSATADQSTAWGSTGMQTMALTAAQSVPAGNFYVAIWSNAGTRPTLRAGATGTASVNGITSAANSPWATADTSITTTGPSTLGSFTALSNAIWVGVS